MHRYIHDVGNPSRMTKNVLMKSLGTQCVQIAELELMPRSKQSSQMYVFIIHTVYVQ